MTDGLILRSESWQLGLAGRLNFCFIKIILFSGYFQIPDKDLNLQIQISFRDEQHFILPASRLLLISGCCQGLSRLLEERGVLALLSPACQSCGVSGVKAGWEPFSGGCALVFREQAWALGCPCDLARQDCGRGFLCSSAALEAKTPEKGCHRNPDCSLALTRSDLIRGFSGATQRSISIKMFQSFHWRHQFIEQAVPAAAPAFRRWGGAQPSATLPSQSNKVGRSPHSCHTECVLKPVKSHKVSDIGTKELQVIFPGLQLLLWKGRELH